MYGGWGIWWISRDYSCFHGFRGNAYKPEQTKKYTLPRWNMEARKVARLHFKILTNEIYLYKMIRRIYKRI